MSTYLFLRCLDHDPPLESPTESGQHLYDLPQIRADIADRDALVRIHGGDLWAVDLGHFRNATLRFLTQHPRCRVGIWDEYGTSTRWPRRERHDLHPRR